LEEVVTMGKRRVLSESDLKDTPLPKEGQLVGIAKKLLGADRVLVICSDGKERVCRIKGSIRRKVWIRVGDAVLVELWGFQNDTRGDVIGKYTKAQKQWLIENGYIPEYIANI
jgi:translation initiation factor 1A